MPSTGPAAIAMGCGRWWAQQLRPDQALPPGAFEPGLYEVDESFQKDLRDAIKDTPLS